MWWCRCSRLRYCDRNPGARGRIVVRAEDRRDAFVLQRASEHGGSVVVHDDIRIDEPQDRAASDRRAAVARAAGTQAPARGDHARAEACRDGRGRIGRAVVDDDQLGDGAVPQEPGQRRERARQHRFAVEYRHDHADRCGPEPAPGLGAGFPSPTREATFTTAPAVGAARRARRFASARSAWVNRTS